MRIEFGSAGFSRPSLPDVLSGISFTLEPGRILSLLGPNGAGKTTVLGLASGRLRPGTGFVLADGRPLSSYPRAEVARAVAVLPQFERLPFNYSCLEFVLLGRAPHVRPLSMPGDGDYRVARRALEELGIAALADRPAPDLSGGEFQLVRLARCLAQEAKVLMLDEPTSMLDPSNARMLADTLRTLARGGRSILLTTHDVALASFVSDVVVLLARGKIAAAGNPGEVLEPTALGRAFGVRFGDQTVPGVFTSAAG